MAFAVGAMTLEFQIYVYISHNIALMSYFVSKFSFLLPKFRNLHFENTSNVSGASIINFALKFASQNFTGKYDGARWVYISIAKSGNWKAMHRLG